MNTPRTDAHSDKMDNEDFDVELALTYDLARQLERELATMTALADRLAKQLQAWVEASGSMFFQEDVEALAAYENHKKQTP